MLLAEKKSLIQFVSVFVALNIAFLVIISMLYYHYQKKIYTEILQNEMVNYAETAYESIYFVQEVKDIDEFLLHDPRFSIALMKKNNVVVYPKPSDIKVKFKKGFFREGKYYFYIKTIEMESIKDIHYLVVRGKTINKELDEIKKTITLFLIFSILFFTIVIFILSKFFLRPLRQYIELLNKFITDAIHELNTPISILSMSLETIKSDELNQKTKKSMHRMLVATRTLSHLFNDLTFTMYTHENYPLEKIRADRLILDRLDYFAPLASTKGIKYIKELKECEIIINERLLSRIIDNLLSNAIKYNKNFGEIKVSLDENSLTIADSGIGFNQADSEEIFKRYARLDTSNGGFGLGLSIVKSLCDLYKIDIKVYSQKNIGTTFILFWDNSLKIHAE